MVIVASAAVVGFTTTLDLHACGDKYLRVGHSARLKGYAAMHPAAILVYQPATPDLKGAKEFEEMLLRAGHKPVFVPHGSDIVRAASSAKYDLLIANYADAPAILEQLRLLPARPDIVPMIVKKPSKDVEAQIKSGYHCLLAPYRMTKFDALEEIDHAMATRQKAMASTGSAR